MDQSRENEFLLYLAVQSVRGSRVMTLPEGLDYASLFAKAGRAGVFRAVAGLRRSSCRMRDGKRSTASPRAKHASSVTPPPSSPRWKTAESTACRWTALPSARSTRAKPSAK